MNSMEKARAKMMLKHVFFASLVLPTRVEPNKNIPTACTDMVRIWYNPDFIESLDQDTILFVLAHEVMHIALKHGLRLQGRNPQRANIAMDFAINLMLKKSGFKIWEYALCDDKYDGMSWEQIYDQREKERNERIKEINDGIKDGSVKIKFGKGYAGLGTPDNGSDEQIEGGLGDVIEPENLDPEARAILERAIDQQVARATSIARMQGKLPGVIERLVDGILNPPLPWQDLLREFMTQATKDDESWAHRNRRHQGVYLPARWSPAMGEIVMIGDTSGSIGNEEFMQIMGEMQEIAEYIKPERIRMIWADDSECSREEVFEAGDPIDIHPVGGGGTDMRKPCLYVERFDPIVVVLITDGYSPWPEHEPPYPLIVICTTNALVPVGQVVRML